MLKVFAIAAGLLVASSALADVPDQGIVRTPAIRVGQQACSDYETQKILWFNSTVVHRLHEMNMDFEPDGTIDPNVYIEVHTELSREIFKFQDRYETAVKKIILTDPKCRIYVDHALNDWMVIIRKYPGLENFSVQ